MISKAALIGSVSPQLFERASDEAGRKITTYQELCMISFYDS